MNYDEALKDLESLVSITCDGEKLLSRTKSALETAKKEHERLEKVEELLDMFSSEFMAYKLYEQIKILEKELEEQK
jgi:hypothetical protein